MTSGTGQALRSFADRIKGFARDLLIETGGRHRSTRRVVRPLVSRETDTGSRETDTGSRETDTGITRLNGAHPLDIEKKCHHPERQSCH